MKTTVEAVNPVRQLDASVGQLPVCETRIFRVRNFSACNVTKFWRMRRSSPPKTQMYGYTSVHAGFLSCNILLYSEDNCIFYPYSRQINIICPK
jgi:hypothetical protein